MIGQLTGFITTTPVLTANSFAGSYRGQKQIWFAMRFLGHEDEIDLGGWNAEFDAWKWTSLSSTVSMIIEFKKAVYEKIISHFSYLENETWRESS